MVRGVIAHQGFHILVKASCLGLLQAPALCRPPVLLIHIICMHPCPHHTRRPPRPPLQTGNASPACISPLACSRCPGSPHKQETGG